MKKVWDWRSFLVLCLSLIVFGGCASDDDKKTTSTPPTFVVKDTAGNAVAEATVYAIPAADVAELGTVALESSGGIYTDAALAADEPLEDLINGKYIPASGGVTTYQSAVTNADGKAEIKTLAGDTAKYFIYVKPADTDTEHLPGGSICRTSVTGDSLNKKKTAITVSTTPSATATFVGSSKCIVCHDTYKTEKSTMHKLGIRVPGTDSALQDLASFPYKDEYDAGFAKFTAGTSTSGGTTVYFSDYDSTRKFDKFKTSETAPTSGTIWATLRLYKDSSSGKYMMQLKNVIDSADTNSPLNLEVSMNYGGGLYKQRYLTKLTGKESLYVLPLQFNVKGSDSSSDRVRKVWRDYHMDWWVTVNTAKTSMTLKSAPAASNSFDIQCATCHYTGYTVTKTAAGEYVATGVADENGEIHPVTSVKQEMNIGCETCHGPGSDHVAAEGKGKAIITPSNLTPERAVTLCVQCHTRPQGNDSFAIKKDSPLNAQDKMMRAGISRTQFLAENTSRHDATDTDYWSDKTHSKSHHQQATDFLKSKKYRNGDKLLTCASCHDPHAAGSDRHQLSGTSDKSLCQSCHTAVTDVVAHSTEKLGASMGTNVTCGQCHNTKTAGSGAGLNATTPFVGDTGTKYFEGDITSHLFDVPRKTVATKDNTMPVPYTNTCGSCHFKSSL
ncbi:MAG: hypothetical protein HQM12_17240 [SAR324 cluster bacterium]|nr:hypothetical protein [SAR324 cluster bacterium]